MQPQYITLVDFILFPFIFFLIYRVALILRNKYFPKGNPMRNYFVPALLLKVLGAVAFGVVYQYYYGYGDTFGYYDMGNFFSKILKDHPTDFFKIYLTGGDDYFTPKGYHYNFDYLYNHNIPTLIVARLCSFIGLFTFRNYLLISIGFAILSFSGVWKLYRMFVTLYPSLNKYLAWAILFVPSVIFWGSGILKDSLTLSALGWFTYSAWCIFFLRKGVSRYSLILVVCVWGLLLIKAYILLSFLPALLLWLAGTYYRKITNKAIRILVWPLFVGGLILASIEINELIASEKKELSFDQITSTALGTGSTLQSYDAGSTYNLGTISPTLGNIILNSPLALVTTLFRPFFWEVKNIAMLSSAVESFLLLLLTLWVIIKVGPFRIIGYIFSKTIIMFCFVFSVIFSIGVAISSGNFGTLVRYKLPALPFYLIFLVLVYHYGTERELFLKQKQSRKLNLAIS
jgi:hypothetical protein